MESAAAPRERAKAPDLVLKNPPPKLIVTRPEPDASAFAERARAAGFEPILSPAMTVAFSSAPPRLEGVGALAFTSANGVRAFAAAGGPSTLPVFAVGGITAAEAARLGFQNVTAGGGDVGSLADAIAAAFAEGRFTGTVLHIGGADRAGDLVGALAGLGVKAELAVLYRAVPAASLGSEAAAALAATPAADSVALFSPRSARIFLDLVRQAGLESRLKGIIAACLSEAVAKEAAEASWRGVIVAEERTGESLLSTLLQEIGGESG